MATLLKSSNFNGTLGNHFWLNLYYELVSQDIENNTSTIKYSLYWKADTNYRASGATSTGYINGSSVGTATSISPNENKLLGTKTVTVKHADDGKFPNTSYSASIDTPWTIGDASVSGTLTSSNIPTIPRASVPTATSGNVEETIVIYTNRKSSSFTHTLKYTFGSLSGTIATGVTNSKSWTLPSSFYAQFPNASYKDGTITCETYSGSKLVGTKTCKFTAYASEAKCKPVVSIVVEDTNTKATELTGSNQNLIKFVSNVEVTATPTAKNSATIKNTILKNETKSYSGTSTTFQAVESGIFKAETKDSRGFTGTTEKTLSIIDYVKLTCNVDLYRETQTGSKVLADISGNFFNGSFGEIENEMTLQYRYKEKLLPDAEWSEWQTIPVTINENNTYQASRVNLGEIFDYQKYYDFQFIAKDKIMEAPNNPDTLQPGIPIFAMFEKFVEMWGEKVFYIGEESGGGVKFRINPDYIGYPVGSLYMTTKSENPSTYLDGTWVSWGSGKFPVGVNTSDTNFNTVEKTGGNLSHTHTTSAHTLTIDEIPKHSHEIGAYYNMTPTGGNYTGLGVISSKPQLKSPAYMDSTGGGKGHNHGNTGSTSSLPPYITCYIWKRIK